MKNYKKHGFTLVELIVVITILLILGTIAFISLQGYSENSRDSARISDLSRMKTSLEIFNIEAGKYPQPTEAIDITYSGGIVWNQGTFGESVYANVEKLSKTPTDPLTNSLYTYSITQNKTEFQIGGILENNEFTLNPIDRLYAGEVKAIAHVVGNYNGKVIKSGSGVICNILSVPSILATDVNTSSDLVNILTDKKLVYEGFNNLPESYKNSKFKYDGGFNYIPNNLVLYSDTGSCLPLSNDKNLRIQLANAISSSYSGTIIEKNIGLNNDTNTNGTMAVMKYSLGVNVPADELTTINTSTGTTNTSTLDTTAPIILSSGPIGTITSSGTTITLTTDETSLCKYDTVNVDYDTMGNTFSTSMGTNHETPYTATGGLNNIYAVCRDSSGNDSLTENISFTYTYQAPINISMNPISGGIYTCDLCN
ncbi:MAG: prepilin-type N-terminal cleavage/methylation domain-containing protein [Candidatus Gracilibacteria bacterium]|nr:prepilin-type N-terminal cleavage/methylation domain-containing protein [Candidatus Gracilibacteria bacterium]